MSELGDADNEFLSAHEKRFAEGRAYRAAQQRKSALMGFANTAMRALLELNGEESVQRKGCDAIAASAFVMADAMLAQLEKRT